MEYEERPKLRALVAYFCAPFGLLTVPKLMPLEDAVDHAKYGAVVLVDPQDERDLAMWERLQRSLQPKRKPWFARD